MKRIIFVWALCLIVSLGSFGVLMFEDRTLGVSLPYSVPVAFASMLALAAALLTVSQVLLARRPVQIIQEAPPAERVKSRQPPRRVIEGIVLLDFSGMVAFNGQGV
jgi:hypothetical protein